MTIEPKHRPGPWRRGKSACKRDIWTSTQPSTCVAFCPCNTGDTFGDTEEKPSYETAIANARLISAAPDLLATCERVLRAIEWTYTADRMTPEEQADILRAAIAKAKETP